MNTKLLTAAAVAIGSAATALTMATAAPAHADELFIGCPSGHSGVATTVTSCAFAENVRYNYIAQGGQIVTAYSPVTGRYYNMQ